jgi:hypothetical protein
MGMKLLVKGFLLPWRNNFSTSNIINNNTSKPVESVDYSYILNLITKKKSRNSKESSPFTIIDVRNKSEIESLENGMIPTSHNIPSTF